MISFGKNNVTVNELFLVLDESNDPVTGLIDADFGKLIYNPQNIEVSDTITVIVSEMGEGIYKVSFTPTLTGVWTLNISNDTYFPAGKRTQIQIFDIYETRAFEDFIVIDEAGAAITGISESAFLVSLYNPSGIEVSGSIPVTIIELGNGFYRSYFTPNTIGVWFLNIIHETYFEYGKSAQINIYPNDTNDIRFIDTGAIPVPTGVEPVHIFYYKKGLIFERSPL